MSDEERRGVIFSISPGDVIVVLGAFWVTINAVERYTSMKRRGGRLVVLIHDIIPITNPEFCVSSLTETFNLCFPLLQIADCVVTVSDYSGKRVLEYLKARRFPIPPIKTLRMAHETWCPHAETVSCSPKVTRILDTPFVLYVSTIEIRKNHTLLFRIWKQLIAKHGAARIPKLVFVGRPGWRVRDLMDQLESTRMLDGHIVLLHGLSDVELSLLYQRALFSAFPSFEEGWGLPVGESLIHGRPCVASNTSSVPEVGGDFVVYADPFNLNESLALYEKMIFDSNFREGLAERIKKKFCPRGWEDVARDLMGLLDQFTKAGDVNRAALPVPTLPSGRLIKVGHGDDMRAFVRGGIGEIIYFIFDEGWGDLENFGRWLVNRTGLLEFSVAEGTGEEALLVLRVDTVPWLTDRTTLALSVNGRRFAIARPTAGQPSYLALRCPVANQKLSIRFEVDGEIALATDPRPLTYGLRSFAYAGLGDSNARLNLLEQMTFELTGVHIVDADAHDA